MRHRQLLLCVLMTLVFFLSNLSGCAFQNTPKRLMAYLPPPQATPESTIKENLPAHEVTGVLIVINDTGFDKSAPALQMGTLQHLGDQLKMELEKQLSIRLPAVVYPEDLSPPGFPEFYKNLAEEKGVPYLLLAVLSSTEREIFRRLPLGGVQQTAGMRS